MRVGAKSRPAALGGALASASGPRIGPPPDRQSSRHLGREGWGCCVSRPGRTRRLPPAKRFGTGRPGGGSSSWRLKPRRRDRLAYRRQPVAHAAQGHQGQYHQPGEPTGRSVCLQADRKRNVIPGAAFGALRWVLAGLVTAWIGLARPGLADERVENAVYDFTVAAVDGEAVDGEAVEGDSFSLIRHGADLMFDGHAFAPGSGAGLASGHHQ